jgi:predicted ATPase
MEQFVVISGCSGGGKSTLLAELSRRGRSVVDELGRRIVKQEMQDGGSALPWIGAIAFARRAIAVALEDRTSAAALSGWVFFNRGLVDAAAALQHLTGEPALAALAQEHRYHRMVFLTPPWPRFKETIRSSATVSRLRKRSILVCWKPTRRLAMKSPFCPRSVFRSEPISSRGFCSPQNP